MTNIVYAAGFLSGSGIAILVGIIAAVVGIVIGFFVGYNNRRKKAEREIGSAEEEAQRIRKDAQKLAETMKKEALLEAKEEIIQSICRYCRMYRFRQRPLMHP